MNTQYLMAFVAYFSIILMLGWFFHRQQKTSKDFIMGNRSLNYWVTAFSAQASDMTSWLFQAFPAAFFLYGVSQAWMGIGLVVCMFLNWHLISKKLRVQTEELDSCTLSTFFEKRFNDTSGILRVSTAAMALFFTTFYLSASLIGIGNMLESLFQMDYFVGISIAVVVVVIYTIIGGYYTVAQIDQFQAIFLLLMVILVPSVAFTHLPNGFEGIIETAKKLDISLQLFPTGSFFEILMLLQISLGWGLGYFGQPHIITKFMGIKSPEELVKSKYLGISWQIISLTAAATVGLIGISYFNGFMNNPELVFVEMVKQLFHPFIGGFILCAVLAASMSTMDSQILVCASIISEDFFKHLFKRHASQKELLLISRIGVLLVSLIALLIAFDRSTSLMDAVYYAWAGLGASFGPLVLMALYYKKTNKYGAFAGIIIGGCIAAFWPTINHLFFPQLTIYSMVPGFFCSLLGIYLVSNIKIAKREA